MTAARINDKGLLLAALLLAALLGTGARAETAASGKDTGPASARCDTLEKASDTWRACVGTAGAGMPDAELFYAGYWLAKSGQYREALAYLTRAARKDERVLTYIGFATRKLGDVEAAMPFYAEALALNPDYSVARAYRGEAHLAKGELGEARAELAEIGRRCGGTCAEYADLAGHIQSYEARRAGKG